MSFKSFLNSSVKKEPTSLEKLKNVSRPIGSKKNPNYRIVWGDPERKKDTLPSCLYCNSPNVVKRGTRKNKLEVVQLYRCNQCNKTFTPRASRGKHYPLSLILDGLSYYHLGYSLEDSVRFLKKDHDIQIGTATLSSWIKEYKDICPYTRIRDFGKKLYSPQGILIGINLYHRQIYKFRVHRAKLDLLLQEDIRHWKYRRLRDFLYAVFEECPHYMFKEGQRSSESKVKFDLSQVLIHRKHNTANKITKVVLEAVNENKLRHEAVQQFFLCNDSVTVATEVPIYLLKEDVKHMEKELKFKVPVEIDTVLTGHIDMIQLRNNAVHIMDYKPNASKERPITQLTLYALAMSRLTGLRLHDFKCAWFDEEDYYQFFPLHVVYKLREYQRKHPPEQPELIKAKEL